MSMYQKKLVAVIKQNGKVLREKGDEVKLPFGSEFSILLKNLNSVKAQVRVSIDGNDATEGTWLVIEPNQSLELKRFIKNCNLNSGNRFKFIEKTNSIEQHRGNKADDGLVRIEFQFAQPPAIHNTTYNDIITNFPYNPWWHNQYPQPQIWLSNGNYQTIYTANISGSDTNIGDTSGQCNLNGNIPINNVSCASDSPSKKFSGILRSMNMDTIFVKSSADVNTDGITVPGSISDQQFQYADSFVTDGQTHALIIKLIGYTATGQPITQPITVKSKPKCNTCGLLNNHINNFCSQCGTNLVIV